MEEEKENRLPASDWFDENFIGGFLNSNAKIKDHLTHKYLRISEEMISSRVINHWEKKGLIDDSRPNGKGWRKYSISEMIWIQIIMKLRIFGFSFNKILKVKQDLQVYCNPEETSKFPELDFYLIVCMTSTIPVKLIVYSNGEALIERQSMINHYTKFRFIKDDYISINLNRLYNNGLKNGGREAKSINQPPSPIELEIKNALKENGLKSIFIDAKNKDNYLVKKKNAVNTMGEVVELKKGAGSHIKTTKAEEGNNSFYELEVKKKIKK